MSEYKKAHPNAATLEQVKAGAGLDRSSTSTTQSTTSTPLGQAGKIADFLSCGADHGIHLSDLVRLTAAHDEDTILRLFEGAHRWYGCDTFLVDNIMTAQLRGEIEMGYYRAQSAFAGRLADFCNRLGVHVHLVAHPRKTEGKRPLEADDVGGSGDITNRADNVFKVERVPEERIQELGYSTLLTVLKNREFGARGKVKLEFNEPARRLYQMGGSPVKRYGWERGLTHGS